MAARRSSPAPNVPRPEAARLLSAALSDAGLTIDELAANAKIDRGVVGRILRGETDRPDPEALNGIVKFLPVTMEMALKAYGFEVALTPRHLVDSRLVQAWPLLPKRIQEGLVAIALGAANLEWPANGAGQQ